MPGSIDEAVRLYWEAFKAYPPILYGLSDAGHARLYMAAVERGRPLGDEDCHDIPPDACA